MHELNVRAATKYDTTNVSHERKLLELWEALMPNEKLETRIGEQWGKIGFQGKDPATDFRGMGKKTSYRFFASSIFFSYSHNTSHHLK